MAEKKEKEIIGYYTDNKNICCVECINKDSEMMKKIEQAITAEESEESLHLCEGCKKEIK